MINLREELARLFDEYSHNIVYVRRDERFRCDCYNERSGEPSADCHKCFGTGYAVQLEKVRTRRNISAVPETLIGTNKLKEVGNLAPTAYVYYLEHDVQPKQDDYILEVIWSSKGMPLHIKEKHLISAVEPKFGYQGRVEFYQVYARFDIKGEQDDTALTKR